MTEVNYNGKEELLMADYEGISDSDLTSKYTNTDFDITDAPSTYITNTQMTYALTCKRLFPAGDTYICNDEGTYKKGHTYQIKVSGETKSWEDITPSGGITVLNATTDFPLSADVLAKVKANPQNYAILGKQNDEIYDTLYSYSQTINNVLIYKNNPLNNAKFNNKISANYYGINNDGTIALYTAPPLVSLDTNSITRNPSNQGNMTNIRAIALYDKTNNTYVSAEGVAKLAEQNTFTAQNTFTEEILANKGMSSDGNIVANNSVFKATDTTKDIVTQYKADEIIKENGTTGETGSTTVNIKLPSTSGTLAATKHSIIKNNDSSITGQENKEDSWLIQDEDATVSIGYQNGSNQASFSASKGFVEISGIDTTGASKFTATPSQILMEVQGTETGNGMRFKATKEDITINDKSVEQRYLDLTGDTGTLDNGQYALVTTYDDLIIRIAGVTYRQQSKPINGSGDYVFASRYYKQATSTTSKEKDDYIVVIKTDKTWTLIIDKDNADNAILYSQAQALTQEQKNMACSNMGLSQSYEVSDADNTTIIRFGNIVFQSATFTITGNSEKVWSFPVSYDTDKIPQCWLHDSGSATSANNSAGITEKTNSSMTVRTCGQDSQVTFFALGWKS